MAYTVPLNDPNAETPDAAQHRSRRSCCSGWPTRTCPISPISTNPGYNPYVTVDYVDMTARSPAGRSTTPGSYNATGQINGPCPTCHTGTPTAASSPTRGSTLLKQQPNPANPMGTPQTPSIAITPQHHAPEQQPQPAGGLPGLRLAGPPGPAARQPGRAAVRLGVQAARVDAAVRQERRRPACSATTPHGSTRTPGCTACWSSSR